jgi:hypothetical protein
MEAVPAAMLKGSMMKQVVGSERCWSKLLELNSMAGSLGRLFPWQVAVRLLVGWDVHLHIFRYRADEREHSIGEEL